MDFYGLTRRELQTLCKLNKIPANITNVAMADALTALPTVIGLDEIQENPQFLSPQKAEAESPALPRTCRRTSALRKPIGNDPKDVSASPMPRSRQRTKRAIGSKDQEEDEGAPQTPANGTKPTASLLLTRRTATKRAGNKEVEVSGTPSNVLRSSSAVVRQSARIRSAIALRKADDGGPVEVQESPAGVGGHRTRLSTRKRMEEAMEAVTYMAGSSSKTAGRRNARGKVGVAKMAALTQEQEQIDQDIPEIKITEEPTEKEKPDEAASGVTSGSINPETVLTEGSSDHPAIGNNGTDGGDCRSGQEEQRSVKFPLAEGRNLVLDAGDTGEETLIEGIASLEINTDHDSPIKGLISLDQTVEVEIYDQDVRGEAGVDLDFHHQQNQLSEIEPSNEVLPTPFDPSPEDQTVEDEGIYQDRNEEGGCDRKPEEPIKEISPASETLATGVGVGAVVVNNSPDLLTGEAPVEIKEIGDTESASKSCGDIINNSLDTNINVPVEEEEEANLDLLTGEAPVEIKKIGDIESSSKSCGDIISESPDVTGAEAPLEITKIGDIENSTRSGGDIINASPDVYLDLLAGELPVENKVIGDINIPEDTSSGSGIINESPLEIKQVGETNLPVDTVDESPHRNLASRNIVSSSSIIGRSGGSVKKKKEGEGWKRPEADDKENAAIYSPSPPSNNMKILALSSSVEGVKGVESAKANNKQVLKANNKQQEDFQKFSMRRLKKLLSESNSNSSQKNNMIVVTDANKVEGKRSALSTLNENCLSP